MLSSRSCDCLLYSTDSLVKGTEEVTVVMPTDVHSTAEPVQPVEQLTEESTKQSDIEEHKDTSKSFTFSISLAIHIVNDFSSVVSCVVMLINAYLISSHNIMHLIKS